MSGPQGREEEEEEEGEGEKVRRGQGSQMVAQMSEDLVAYSIHPS